MKILVLTGLIIVSLLSSVSATPSSLIWIPSTNIQSQDKTHFGIDSYFTPNAALLIGYSFYNNQDFKNTITTQLDVNF